jgi:hypothetical protein
MSTVAQVKTEHRNEVKIVGESLKTPTIRTASTGTVVSNFMVKTATGKYPETHKCVAFGVLYAEKLTEGRRPC